MSPCRAWAVPALLLLLPALAAAATHRVPEDFPLIQSAIDAAATGDVIRVGPGTYDENLAVLGKSVSLISTAGADATIVDGGRRDRVLLLAGGVVDGFTIRNGYKGTGAGIYLQCDEPSVVRNCVVRDNEAMSSGGIGGPGGDGGGIYIASGNTEDIVVEGNVIKANSSFSMGGGISCDTGYEAGVVRDNLISGNWAQHFGGGVMMNGGALQRNRIVGNSSWILGGGVDLWYGECRGNTIVGNSSEDGSGVCGRGGAVTGNIVAGNHGGHGIRVGSVTLECNDAWGNEGGDFSLGGRDTTGTNNLSADPLFCGPDDYHVSTESPCVGTGACGLIGALPAACGVTAVRRVTWGALKGAYR